MSAKTAPIDITATLQRDAEAPVAKGEVVFGINDLSVSYGSNLALSGVSLDIYKNLITAMIGPSGCGKSTFIRCLNRMNDLVPGVKVDGKIL
jgi:phosphate transport system ATP-binding protein